MLRGGEVGYWFTSTVVQAAQESRKRKKARIEELQRSVVMLTYCKQETKICTLRISRKQKRVSPDNNDQHHPTRGIHSTRRDEKNLQSCDWVIRDTGREDARGRTGPRARVQWIPIAWFPTIQARMLPGQVHDSSTIHCRFSNAHAAARSPYFSRNCQIGTRDWSDGLTQAVDCGSTAARPGCRYLVSALAPCVADSAMARYGSRGQLFHLVS